jgi:exodeoxyribonuclease VII large subunit
VSFDESRRPARPGPQRTLEDALPREVPEPRVLSVSQLGRLLKTELERSTEDVNVEGEVTGLKMVQSGHAYFCLRDEREEAVIDCVMYRTAAVRARKLLAEGARLVLTGRVTFWAPRGRIQMVVEGARAVGRGALLEALEKRKAALAKEGLFAAARKRPLPKEPLVIGLVTSGQGAALRDIVKVAFERARVRFILVTAPVQGAGAAEALARALKSCARHPEVEAIILGRGGGSADDLAPFNEEVLVRAVAACRVPVVTAVGHEIDLTLVDMAADKRASTPSNAAELLVPDMRARLAILRQQRARLDRAVTQKLGEATQRVDVLGQELASIMLRGVHARRDRVTKLERRLAVRHPAAVVAAAREALSPLERRLERAARRVLEEQRGVVPALAQRLDAAMAVRFAEAKSALGESAARLEALSPLAVLGRGYAIARRARDGAVLRSPGDAAPGERIDVRLGEGSLTAIVVKGDEPSS